MSGDAEREFVGVMAGHGIVPAEPLRLDGRLQRFRAEGDSRRNSWCVLHLDDWPAGEFGCWKRGVRESWKAGKPARDLSEEERRAWKERLDSRRRKSRANAEQKHARAQRFAARMVEKAKPASPDHPYLRRKGIQPHGALELRGELLIPAYIQGKGRVGVQRIPPEGDKFFLTGQEVAGSYHGIGELRGTLLITEGFATAATAYEATGHAVAVAFSASNLKAVAEALRRKHGPNVRFLILADNDPAGIKGSQEAADAVGARVALPVFARDETGSDWNDLAAARGPEAVAAGVESALRGAWPPEFLTLAERLARPRRPVSWRIEGWQPSHSRVLLSAQFKSGKTTLRDNLCRSLLDGDPFLGSAPVRPVEGTVAILDTEMSERQGDEWQREQGIGNADRLHVEYLRGQLSLFDIRDPELRGRWAELLRSHRVEFLVLDCLRPLLDALNLSEHNEVGKFFVAFDALLSEAGITDALLIHHMGHTAERARGDSRLRDWPEVEWIMVRQSEDPSSTRFLSAYGRDVDQPEQQLAFDPETRHLRLVGGSRKEAVDAGALDEVLALLERLPEPISGRGAEDSLEGDVPRDQVRKALKVGIKRGDILTEKGPRNATLHRLNPERAGARGQRAPRTECERAAPLGSRALAHSEAEPDFSERAVDVPRAPALGSIEDVFGEYIEP